MPIVNTNIIKEWFSNLKKPPQEQFWAWLDSFRHKWEKVPLDDVEGLTGILQKKADLVNGVVPEDQLPFSVVTSEVITLGSVELIDTKTYLRLHSSGANKVRVKGKLITRTFQNQWTITPIVADGVKVLRGYAVKNNDDFLLAEGAELPTYKEPEIPEDALEIFKITMRSSGNVIEQTETGLKYIAEDGWRNILLTEELTVLPYNFDLKSSYWINSRVANPVIGGIHNGVIDRNASPTWDGKEFWLFNNTGGDLLLDPANVTAIDVYLFSDKLMPLTIKNNNAVLLKLKDNVIEIMQGGGGGASFPVTGNDGDVLVKDTTVEGGVKFSNRLTLAESEIDVEIVNRAAADNALQTQINTNATAISTETTNRTNADATLQAAIDAEVVNRAAGDSNLQTQVNTLNSHKSSVVDKFLHYWDSSAQKWISSGLKFISGAINQLEFTGRIKADAIILQNNTSPVVANRLRSSGRNLFYSDDSSTERRVLLSNDASFGFDEYITAFFTDSLALMRPIQYNQTGYFLLNNDGADLFQGGRSRPFGPQENAILYSSSLASTGRIHGSTMRINTVNTFSVFRKFVINTTIPTQRVFVGYSDNWRVPTANPTNVAMSTLTDVIGVCMETGSSNLFFIHNDFTGSATLVDTGFTHASKYIYELTLTHLYGDSFLNIRLRRIDSTNGSVQDAVYKITSDYNLKIEYAAMWCVDSLATSVVSFWDYGLLKMHRIPYL